MVAKNNHSERSPQAKQNHPDELQRDSSLNHMAGQNIGGGPSSLAPSERFASGTKELTRRPQDFTSDERRELPVLPEAVRLLLNAVPIDLAAPERRAFRATAQAAVSRRQRQVPRSEAPSPVLESAGTNQRPTATAVMRPSDAG